VPPQIACAYALSAKTGKHENRIFHSNSGTSRSLISSVFLTHDSYAVWLPKSCYQCVQLGVVVGHGSGERKSREAQQLDCVALTMHVHQCAVFLKEKKCHLWCVW